MIQNSKVKCWKGIVMGREDTRKGLYLKMFLRGLGSIGKIHYWEETVQERDNIGRYCFGKEYYLRKDLTRKSYNFHCILLGWDSTGKIWYLEGTVLGRKSTITGRYWKRILLEMGV